MRQGFNSYDSDFEPPCPSSVRPGTEIKEFMVQASREGKPDNMCSWALELTRNDPMCLGLDFRLLHRRFKSVFHGVKARCQPNSARPCNGLGPNCLRYKGTQVSDQSAHDYTCSFYNVSEPKLKWDEALDRPVSGETRGEDAVQPGRLGRLVAICDSGKRRSKRQYTADILSVRPKSHRWLWKGVYEWSEHVPMPEFQACSQFWIG